MKCKRNNIQQYDSDRKPGNPDTYERTRVKQEDMHYRVSCIMALAPDNGLLPAGPRRNGKCDAVTARRNINRAPDPTFCSILRVVPVLVQHHIRTQDLRKHTYVVAALLGLPLSACRSPSNLARALRQPVLHPESSAVGSFQTMPHHC